MSSVLCCLKQLALHHVYPVCALYCSVATGLICDGCRQHDVEYVDGSRQPNARALHRTESHCMPFCCWVVLLWGWLQTT